MQKFTFTIFVVLVLSACNYKVYVNGKFDHTDKRRDSTNSTCLVIDNDSIFPDSATFINKTKIIKHQQGPSYFAYQEIINKAKLEANKAGGNAIKINYYGPTRTIFHLANHSRYKIEVETYLVKDSFLVKYLKKIDSIKIKNKNLNIIHLKCDNWRGLVVDRVYFNNSLICEFPNKTKMKYRLFNWQTNKNGILLYENDYNKKNRWIKKSIQTEIGNEYYFRLHASKYGGSIMKVDRFRFYYLNY